ncbi:hypothetical protein PHLCEN_2v5816 [Hermanssonia centrifuga]|uniref:Transmembrane protein n=1 Tax=Hermanssonia centrifuga TaxID=98765 RepID=A0A2R6P195_9APHY|nr:hypothetical protein PHLCEN_2v5816 [Hermanssonia centrifuga]
MHSRLFQDVAQAALVNTTLDVSDPQLVYSPTNEWTFSEYIGSQIDTIRSATFNPATNSSNTTQTASLQFNGSAIYVVGLISHSRFDAVRASDIRFYIDGQLSGNFTAPDPGTGGQGLYTENATLYANSSIPNGSHNFTVQNGRQGGSPSLTVLDYIVYTSDDAESAPQVIQQSPTSSPSSNQSSSTFASSSTSSSTISVMPTTSVSLSAGSSISAHTKDVIIASAVSVGLFVMALLAIILILYRRRSKPQVDPQDDTSTRNLWAPVPFVLHQQTNIAVSVPARLITRTMGMMGQSKRAAPDLLQPQDLHNAALDPPVSLLIDSPFAGEASTSNQPGPSSSNIQHPAHNNWASGASEIAASDVPPPYQSVQGGDQR